MELATCDKYYDKVLERFPELTYKQLDKIIKHGLMSLYLYNLYGGDVLLKHPKFTMYFGKLFNDCKVFYNYWKLKWKIKLRIKYKKAKTKYDGYYYFGLRKDEFEKYKDIFKKSRKRRRVITFPKLIMFKILDECLVHKEFKHFFKIPYPEDCGFTMYKENWTAKDFEYILKRNEHNEIESVSYEQTKRDKYLNRRFK